MSHDDDLENLPDDELVAALKELEIEKQRERFERQTLQSSDFNLRKVRPTESPLGFTLHPKQLVSQKLRY